MWRIRTLERAGFNPLNAEERSRRNEHDTYKRDNAIRRKRYGGKVWLISKLMLCSLGDRAGSRDSYYTID